MTQRVNCIDTRYVANKVKEMETTKDEKKLRKMITEFKEELVYNVGIDTIREYNNEPE